MKLVWNFDLQSKQLVGTSAKEVSDDYVLEDGETFIPPETGLLSPIIFDTDNQKWVGTDTDTWLKNNAPKEKLSDEYIAIAALAKQVLAIQLKG